MNFFAPSSLALVGSIGAIALSCLMGFLAANFQIRRARLPDATAYEDIRERRISEEQRLSNLRDEVRLIEKQIKDKDRLSAEVAALQERLDSLRYELASLDAARTEIEEVKHQAADAAGQLAAALQDCKAAEVDLAQKRRDLDEIEKRLEPARITALEEALNALKSERYALESELPSMRAERDAALQRLEEARSFEAHRAALQVEIKGLEDQMVKISQECAALQEEKRDLTVNRQVQEQIADDVGRLEMRRNSLTTEIEELKQGREDLDEVHSEISLAASSLAAVRNRHEDLEQEVVRLEARRERLSDDIVGKPKEAALLLEDIKKFPACLVAPAILARVPKPESEALDAVLKYVSDCELHYDFRTLRAFHTCLKINDYAQITVLAGVSGTGKSMLPRRYAEAMGIHFHQIAVEPRWDSPQDLLGFYNYIELKYRATDLSRLMVHMDPYRSVPLEGDVQDRRDHMALVLLDEMNLARVEYYFSEFLSRLEVRPRLSDADDELRRKNAMMPIDIRGYEKNLALFPSHNVLFAGTMNDDESTQALSDKVLDRGNVIQFAAPKKFNSHKGNPDPLIPREALPFTTWKGWLRKIDFNRDNLADADKHIAKLARIMDECGRPFGHRLRDAILSYAANYPKLKSGSQDLRVPIIDQIELRILPKLRGLEINAYNPALSEFEAMIRTDLDDTPLADHLRVLIEKQAAGAGLFNWRGFTRSNG